MDTYIHKNVVLNIIIFIIDQSILFSACPCKNGGQCMPGVDSDENGQEDCDCSLAIGFEGVTCETATGSKLLIHTYIHTYIIWIHAHTWIPWI